MKKGIVFLLVAGFVLTAMAGFSVSQEVADSHQQAAEAFLLAMDTPDQLKEGVIAMVDMMMQGNPMLEPYREQITTFYQKYLSWEALKSDYIRTAQELLTEKQLKDLTAFFQTESGRVFIEKQPEMFQRTSEIGFRVMQEHQQELMDILQAEIEKMEPVKQIGEGSDDQAEKAAVQK